MMVPRYGLQWGWLRIHLFSPDTKCVRWRPCSRHCGSYKRKNRLYSSIFLKLSRTRWISNECLGDQRRQMLFLPGTPIQRLFPGWHRRGMMTYITTGAGGGGRGFRICLSWSVHSLCFHKPFFLPLRTFRAKSEPTDPGCWRRVKAGKVPWTVLAINRKDIFKQKWFSKSPWKETKGFSQMNPG